MVKQLRSQGPEQSGHIASLVRKLRMENATAQLTFSLMYNPGSQWCEWGCPQWVGLHKSINPIGTTPQSLPREHPQGDDKAHHVDIDHYRFACLFNEWAVESPFRLGWACPHHMSFPDDLWSSWDSEPLGLLLQGHLLAFVKLLLTSLVFFSASHLYVKRCVLVPIVMPLTLSGSFP